MNRLAERVSRLEDLRDRLARERGRPFWWELPEDQWHSGATGPSHEEAIALLDAEGGPRRLGAVPANRLSGCAA